MREKSVRSSSARRLAESQHRCARPVLWRNWVRGLVVLVLFGAMPFRGDATLASAQTLVRTFLPALWRQPDRVFGTVIGVSTLATTPDLILVEIDARWYTLPEVPFSEYLSRDGGGHWERIATRPWLAADPPSYYSSNRFALLAGPSGPLLVAGYVHAGPIGGVVTSIYVSADYGATWTQQTTPTAPGCPVLMLNTFLTTPARPGRLYAELACAAALPAGPTFIWIESDDAGVTWTPVLDPTDMGRTVVLSPARADRLFRVTDTRLLERSDTDGADWVPIGTAPSESISLTLTDANRILASAGGGLFVSSDGGVTWLALNNLPCGFSGIPFLAEVPGTTPLILTRCADGRLLATATAGQTWSTLPAAPWSAQHVLHAYQDAAVPGRIWLQTFGPEPSGLWRLDAGPAKPWVPVLLTYLAD